MISFLRKLFRLDDSSYCLVMKTKYTPDAKKAAQLHAKLLTRFFRRQGLCKYHFDFCQRTHTAYEQVGRVFINLKLVLEDRREVCIVKVCAEKGGVWTYVVEHSDLSASGIHKILLEKGICENKKTFLQSRIHAFIERVINRFEKQKTLHGLPMNV